MDHYYRLFLCNVLARDEDALTHFLFESGAGGVSEKLDFSQPSGSFQAEILEKPVKDLEAYFEEEPALEVIKTLREQFSNIEVQVEAKKKEDWMAKWKEGWTAFSLVDQYWVIPSWEEEKGPNKVKISIDPGMAFGTGTHATTQVCSRLLVDLLKENKIQSLLDVGCGTAILSILAKHLGVETIEATEIDEDARECAKENVKRNHCENILILDQQIESLNKQYDLVIANIIDPVLLQIKEDLFNTTKEGAYLILSGIIEDRKEVFEESFLNKNWRVVKSLKQDEWWAYLLKKV